MVSLDSGYNTYDARHYEPVVYTWILGDPDSGVHSGGSKDARNRGESDDRHDHRSCRGVSIFRRTSHTRVSCSGLQYDHLTVSRSRCVKEKP